MENNLTTGVVSVLLAIVGVATLAVILSKNANTQGVIAAGGTAFSNSLIAAEAPVSNSSGMGLSLQSYPSTSLVG